MCCVRTRSCGTWSGEYTVHVYFTCSTDERTCSTVTFTLTRSDLDAALGCLTRLLKALPHLHTIQVHNCKVTAQFARALRKTTLPSVRVLVLPDGAAPLIQACPNATHVRCAGGSGDNLIVALQFCKCEVYDGPVNWTPAQDSMQCASPVRHNLF